MTEQRKKFCEEILAGRDMAEAVTRAGYVNANPKKCGQNLLKKPEIRDYLTARGWSGAEEPCDGEEQDSAGEQPVQGREMKIANAEEILEYLTGVMRGEPGQDEKSPGERERLRAAELIGKRYGLFREGGKPEESAPVVICDDIPGE